METLLAGGAAAEEGQKIGLKPLDYLQGSNMSFQCAENVKAAQATVAGIKSNPKSVFDAHVTFDPIFFDMMSLSRFGK